MKNHYIFITSTLWVPSVWFIIRSVFTVTKPTQLRFGTLSWAATSARTLGFLLSCLPHSDPTPASFARTTRFLLNDFCTCDCRGGPFSCRWIEGPLCLHAGSSRHSAGQHQTTFAVVRLIELQSRWDLGLDGALAWAAHACWKTCAATCSMSMVAVAVGSWAKCWAKTARNVCRRAARPPNPLLCVF